MQPPGGVCADIKGGVWSSHALTLTTCGLGVTEVQQQADEHIVDLVPEDRLSVCKLGQGSQEHHGSTADGLVPLHSRRDMRCMKPQPDFPIGYYEQFSIQYAP